MASLYLVDGLDDVAVGGSVTLAGAEGRHAVTVARVRVGERLRIADGRGTVVRGEVVAVDKDSLELAVDAVDVEPAPRPSLTLVQALAKGGRDEMAVQAATEIGVDRVVPWSAARSVSRWDGAKVEKGRARLAAIAHEAAKQAIRPLVTTGQLVSALGDGTTLVLLDPTATVRLATWEPPTDAEDIALVVGPEGGIDGAELDRLEAAGAVRVRLGDSVLRTSTAGPAALAVLQARLGRW
jgi:16S rRNA (uracil1498-N3)-methyltransferase